MKNLFRKNNIIIAALAIMIIILAVTMMIPLI